MKDQIDKAKEYFKDNEEINRKKKYLVKKLMAKNPYDKKHLKEAVDLVFYYGYIEGKWK